MATSLGWFDLEFWWELAALITIMLLGHWQEMKALGQAQVALAALAELLPDEAERVGARRGHRDRPARRPAARRRGAGPLRRPGARRRRDRRRRGRARRVDDHRRVPARGQEPPATGSSPAPSPPTRRSGSGSTPSATTPPWPASSAWWPRPRRPAAGPRPWPTASPPCSSTSPPAPRCVTFVAWTAVGTLDEAVVRVGHRAGHRLPARPRAGHPPRGLAVDRARGPAPASWSRTGWRWSGCGPIDAVLFDKTGTLTKGEHVVTGVAGAGRRGRRAGRRTVLRLAGGGGGRQRAPAGPGHRGRGAERGSAAVAAGHGFPVDHRPGRRGHRRRRARYAVGGPALLRERELSEPDALRSVAEGWRGRGAAVLYLVEGERGASAPWRSRTRSGPRRRRPSPSCAGWASRVVMITGDARQVAEAVAASWASTR